MPYQHIRFDLDEQGVALVTVHRPEKLNALSSAVIGELREAFERVAAEPAIRAAILTGTGEKAFVAGADINELAALSPVELRAYALRGQAAFRLLETCGKPSVAAVNGYALGGGLELAMACTVRFASENARLGQPEVKLGIVPGYGGTQRLPRLIGRARALEAMLFGNVYAPAEAERIGMVNRVLPAKDLMPFAMEWARTLSQRSPRSIAGIKRAVHLGVDRDLETGLLIERTEMRDVMCSEDGRTTMNAYNAAVAKDPMEARSKFLKGIGVPPTKGR